MKNKLVVDYLMPLAYSLFFTGALMALIWFTTTYGSFSPAHGSLTALPIAACVCAVLYAGVALASLVNVFKGNKLFAGSSSDVFSVATQKKIRLAGILVAMPALIYAAVFAYMVESYRFTNDFSATDAFANFELSSFGSTHVWDYILPSGTQMSLNPLPEPNVSVAPTPAVPEKEVDFFPYMQALQCQIKKNWSPPKSSDSSRIKTHFKMHSEGYVSDLYIVTSSGNEEADEAALNAIENGAPYLALPAGAPENVDIEFTFDYNSYKRGEPDSEPMFSSSGCCDTFSSSAEPVDRSKAVKPSK